MMYDFPMQVPEKGQEVTFADDGTVYVSGNNLQEITDLMNSVMSNIEQWTEKWKMTKHICSKWKEYKLLPYGSSQGPSEQHQ